MPDPISARRAARGKVVLHLTTDEPVGRSLWEWGYRTPRFPRGIKRSDLSSSEPGVQRETMVAWFLANHVPAVGPYFGFAEAMPRPNPSVLTQSDATGRRLSLARMSSAGLVQTNGLGLRLCSRM